MKNNNLVEKGFKLAEEIIALTKEGKREEVMKEDFPTISDSFASNRHMDELMETLDSEPHFTHTHEQKKVCVENMLFALKRKERAQKRKKILIACSSAAAVVLLFSSILLDLIQKPKEMAVIQITKTNKPQLILSNGDTVDLTGENKIKGYEVDTFRNVVSCNTQSLDTMIGHLEYNTIVIPKMFTCEIVLEDGTLVTLNANSELRYPVKFSGNKREVFLKGEAYFDVTKSEKPFIVSAEGMAVKVYGTQFNVNAGRKNISQTTLISGAIGVTIGDKGEVMMKPNQMLTLDREKEAYTLQEVDPSIYVTWMSDYLSCQKGTLNELLEKTANWYGAVFSFDEEVNQEMNVTISLSKRLPMEEFLKIVSCSLNIQFEKVNNNHYIVHNQN